MFKNELVVKLMDFRKDYLEMSPLTPLKGSILSRLAQKISDDENISCDEADSSGGEKAGWEIIKCPKKREFGKLTENKRQQCFTSVASRGCKTNVSLSEEGSRDDGEENSSDRSWQEDSSSDDERPTLQKIKKAPQKCKFELLVEKNKAEHLAFLKSLEMEQVKTGLLDIVAIAKPKPQKRVLKTNPPLPPRPKSRRIRGLGADDFRPEIVSDIPFKDAATDENVYDSYVKDVNIQEYKNEKCEFITYDKNVVNQLNFEAPCCKRLVPNHCTSLAWYPSLENLIIAGGNFNGQISIWNVESETSPCNFNLYDIYNRRCVTHLQFNPWNPTKLVISTVNRIFTADLVKRVFTVDCFCYVPSGTQRSFSYFDFISPSTYIAITQDGYLTIKDTRIKNSRNSNHSQGSLLTNYRCGHWFTHSISSHPVERSFFITASTTKQIYLWDLRMLKQDPVSKFGPNRTWSTYFSPLTGNSILATAPKSISILDSRQLTNISCKEERKYDLLQQRKSLISSPKASWLPNSEEVFVLSNTRAIDMFDAGMNIVRSLEHRSLSNINAFHPFGRAVAVGIAYNAAGENVSVFKQ